MSFILQAFAIVGSLGIFFYGMKVMSEAVQRLTGDKLQASLNFMTSNRFGGLLTGFFITTVIQSSSATTVMVVSFVNAGLLNLIQSIGVIMGANLGTTLSVWMVSLLGFKFKITLLALPAVAIGIPFIFAKSSRKYNTGELLVGFGLLFLGLNMLKESVPDIKNNVEILRFITEYADMGFLSIPIFVMVGIVLTLVVQSSSAAAAITVTMAFKGWIDFPSGAAIILGENIGTTITAYLAAFGTNVHARRAARAHLLFNILGVIWMLAIFYKFVDFVDWITPGDTADPTNIPIHLSAFHSLFNFVNICLLIGFTPRLAALVERLVPSKKGEDVVEERYELKYISTGILRTPELALVEANKEIIKMAEIIESMYLSALEVFFNPEKDMGEIIKQLKKREEFTDRMEEEISRYLVECSKENLSDENVFRLNAKLRIVDELESIADCCYNLTLTIQNKYDTQLKFHRDANDEIKAFADKVIHFMRLNLEHLKKRERFDDSDLENAYRLENAIDESRSVLRNNSIQRIQEYGHVKSELLFMDILKNFERMGDYSLNISQALLRSGKG
ncbi:MAG: Na/Pi cotransporter family protein [Deltaproteobacteria bacterium]|nr:Na/Pi cotransporter family protein [Deltaproteobacteria bacterium]